MNTYYDTSTNPYVGNFVVDGQETNSPIVELSNALSALSGYATDKNLDMVDGASTSLGHASYRASEIANKFDGVNNNIKESWISVSQFTKKIDNRVSQLIQNFTVEIKNFVDSTVTHEKEIQVATSNAIELAERLLKELGL